MNTSEVKKNKVLTQNVQLIEITLVEIIVNYYIQNTALFSIAPRIFSLLIFFSLFFL